MNLLSINTFISSYLLPLFTIFFTFFLKLYTTMKRPMELVVEILLFLPAKSLLRCRSVCKSWLSLINSTKFKLTHLHNFNQLNSRYLVFRRYMGKELYSVHLDDEALTIDGGTFVEFPFNGSSGNEGFRIGGSCNGVICLFDEEESSFNMIILWNPSIRRKLTLTLPSSSPIDLGGSYFVLGFGYDKMSDDYKVVSLSYVGCFRPTAEVYTLKTGIWREVMFPDDLCCFIIFPEWPKVFFNGSVHWIAYYRTLGPSHNSIMTFDISTELFAQIQLPDDLVNVSQDAMTISVLGESLAVTYYNCLRKGSKSSSSYEIWVMKEYKNSTSWSMIYNMHYPNMYMGIPLQLRNKAEMIMESRDGNMIIHDHDASDIWIEYCTKLHYRSYVDKYQESLVLLDVGVSLPNDE